MTASWAVSRIGVYVETVSRSPTLFEATRSSSAGPLLSMAVTPARTSGSTAVPDSLRSSSVLESSNALRATGPSVPEEPEEYARSAFSNAPV